jgi:predicted dehydrogenase
MWSSKSGRYERIVVGNKGALILEDDTELYLNGKKIVGGPQEPDNFHLEIKEFISSILEDREPLTSGKDNRKVIEVMDACRISSKEHRVVYLDERSE